MRNITVSSTPTILQMTNSFLEIKPVSILCRGEKRTKDGKTTQVSGYISVIIRKITGPSPDNPGLFTFACEVKSLEFKGDLEMSFDYETRMIVHTHTKFIPAKRVSLAS